MGNLKPGPFVGKANPGLVTCAKLGLPFPYVPPRRGVGAGRPARAAKARAGKRAPSPKKKRARR